MFRSSKYLTITLLSTIIAACGGDSSSPTNGLDQSSEDLDLITEEACLVTPSLLTESIEGNLFNQDSVRLSFEEPVRVITSSVTRSGNTINSQAFLDQNNQQVLLRFAKLTEAGTYTFSVSANALACSDDTAPDVFQVTGSVVQPTEEKPAEEKPEIAELSTEFSFPTQGQIIADTEQLDLFFTSSVTIGSEALTLVQNSGSGQQTIALSNPRVSGDNTRFLFDIPDVVSSNLSEGTVALVYEKPAASEDNEATLITDQSSDLAEGENILESFSIAFSINNPSALSRVQGETAVNLSQGDINAEVTLLPGNNIGLTFDRSLNENVQGVTIQNDNIQSGSTDGESTDGENTGVENTEGESTEGEGTEDDGSQNEIIQNQQVAECQQIIADNAELSFILDNGTADIRGFTVISNDCQVFEIKPNTPVVENDRLRLAIDLVDVNETEALDCDDGNSSKPMTGIVDNFCEPVAVIFTSGEDEVRQQVGQVIIDISVPARDEEFGGLSDVVLITTNDENRTASEKSLLTNDGDNTDIDNAAAGRDEVDDSNPTVNDDDVKTIGQLFREFDQVRFIFDEAIAAETVDDQPVAQLVLKNTTTSSNEVVIPLAVTNKTAIAVFTEADSAKPNQQFNTVENMGGSNYQIVDIRGIVDMSGNPYTFNSPERYSKTINRSSDNPLNRLQFEQRFIGLKLGSDDETVYIQADRTTVDDKSDLELIDSETIIPVVLSNYRLNTFELSDDTLCSDDTIRMVRLDEAMDPGQTTINEVELDLSMDGIFAVERNRDQVNCTINLAPLSDEEFVADRIYVVDLTEVDRIVSDEDLTLRGDEFNNSQIIGRFKTAEESSGGLDFFGGN